MPARVLADWDSAYVLNSPFIKYVLYSGVSLSLALVVTVYVGHMSELPNEERSWALWVILIWVTSALYAEMSDVVTDYSWWRADALNVAELMGLTLTMLALVLVCFESVLHVHDSWQDLRATLLASGVACMWLTQGLRVMQISKFLGPMVRMVQEMMDDVIQWLCLTAVFLLAFAASFYNIFVNTVPQAESLEETSDGRPLAVPTPPWLQQRQLKDTHIGIVEPFGPDSDDGWTMDGCGALVTGYGSSVFYGMSELLEIVLGGAESGIDCFKEAPHSESSIFMMMVFLVAAVVLLLNMLIAMMAKTFDRTFDKQPQVYQYLFALLCLNWEEADPTPPPFTLLKPLNAFVMCCLNCCGSAGQSFSRLFEDDSEVQPRRESSYLFAPETQDTCMDDGNDCDSLTLAKRLQGRIDAFFAEHADEADAVDRWRLKLSKTLSSQDCMLRALTTANRELEKKLDAVLQKLDGTSQSEDKADYKEVTAVSATPRASLMAKPLEVAGDMANGVKDILPSALGGKKK